MAITIHELGPQRLTVKRIGSGTWLVRLLGPFDHRAVEALQAVYTDAVERDATDLVIDLGSVQTITAEGAIELVAIAALVRARNAGFWIAAPTSGRDGYALRPVQEDGPEGLIGLSASLDEALTGVLDER